MHSFDEYYKATQKALDEAESVLYPKLPEHAIPSSLSDEQIVGRYHDPGYGTLNIVQADIDGQSWLVANRTEPIFPYELRFKHVSGNYWLVYAYLPDTRSIVGAYATEFTVGADGEAKSLELQQTPRGQLGEPDVSFKRV